MKKLVIFNLVLVFCALGWSAPGRGEQVSAPRGELHVVDKDPLNWVSITFNVMEHLWELDTEGKLVPRLATGWQWLNDHTLKVTLRHGVRFHNAEVFDAEIVKLNWDNNIRLRQPFAPGSYMNFKPGSKLEVLDPYTIEFVFPEPDGAALAKLMAMHMANRQFYREFGWGEKHW